MPHPPRQLPPGIEVPGFSNGSSTGSVNVPVSGRVAAYALGLDKSRTGTGTAQMSTLPGGLT